MRNSQLFLLLLLILYGCSQLCCPVSLCALPKLPARTIAIKSVSHKRTTIEKRVAHLLRMFKLHGSSGLVIHGGRHQPRLQVRFRTMAEDLRGLGLTILNRYSQKVMVAHGKTFLRLSSRLKSDLSRLKKYSRKGRRSVNSDFVTRHLRDLEREIQSSLKSFLKNFSR